MTPPSRNCGSMYSHSRGDLDSLLCWGLLSAFAVGIAIAALIDYADKVPRP